MISPDPVSRSGLSTVGLFAGIGGIERGLESSGHHALLMAENFPAASHVLRLKFPSAKLVDDVLEIGKLPRETDLVAAGFPCQDLSSVGPKIGIAGAKSSLVGAVFSLLEERSVEWVLLENVPFLLDLDRGRALRLITSALEELGYTWAYRVLDAEAFGIPQRRRRWYLLASLNSNPADVLLSGDSVRPAPSDDEVAYGFYWTEGTRALGWAIDSVPPIKCGSTVGVPSPPAVLLPDGQVVCPDIRDAERLQGFPEDWTESVQDLGRASWRWRLVGNAVCVPVTAWIGERLAHPQPYDPSNDEELEGEMRWPKAAWGQHGKVYRSFASDTPVWYDRPHLTDFLKFPVKPLSARAARGFLRRAHKGNLRFKSGFLERVELHAQRQESGG